MYIQRHIVYVCIFWEIIWYIYLLDEDLVSYTNWQTSRDEPDKSRGRDCAAFGYTTDFQWVGAVCDKYPNGFLVICQYGKQM